MISLVDPHTEPPDHAKVSLTPRETEIARLVCEGKLNKQIASHFGLSEYTVENHLRRIYKKLDIHNRTSLVAAIGP